MRTPNICRECSTCSHEYDKRVPVTGGIFIFTLTICLGIWYTMTWVYGLLALKYGGAIAFKAMYGLFMSSVAYKVLTTKYDW